MLLLTVLPFRQVVNGVEACFELFLCIVLGDSFSRRGISFTPDKSLSKLSKSSVDCNFLSADDNIRSGLDASGNVQAKHSSVHYEL